MITGKFIRDKVKARFEADFPVVPPSEIDLMDVGSAADRFYRGFTDPVLGT